MGCPDFNRKIPPPLSGRCPLRPAEPLSGTSPHWAFLQRLQRSTSPLSLLSALSCSANLRLPQHASITQSIALLGSSYPQLIATSTQSTATGSLPFPLTIGTGLELTWCRNIGLPTSVPIRSQLGYLAAVIRLPGDDSGTQSYVTGQQWEYPIHSNYWERLVAGGWLFLFRSQFIPKTVYL
jgi:hypothetical protein